MKEVARTGTRDGLCIIRFLTGHPSPSGGILTKLAMPTNSPATTLTRILSPAVRETKKQGGKEPGTKCREGQGNFVSWLVGGAKCVVRTGESTKI